MRVLIVLLFFACQTEEISYPSYQTEILKLEQDRISDPKLFENYLSSTNKEETLRALDAISKIQDTLFLPALEKYSHNTDKDLKGKAIFGLGQLFNTSAETSLEHLLKDETDDSLRRIEFKAFSKVASYEKLALIKDYLNKYADKYTGYDLSVLHRKDKRFSLLSSFIIKNWSHFPKESYAGFYYFLSRLNKAQLKTFKNFLMKEFKKNIAANSLSNAINAAALLKALEKTELNIPSFLKKYYRFDVNWRLSIAYLKLLKKAPKKVQRSYIADLLSSELHPYIKDYILRNSAAYHFDRSLYSQLILEDQAKNYLAIVEKYPEQSIRYINNHFQAKSIGEQKDLLEVLFKTKNKDALIQFSNFYESLEKPIKSAFVERATQTNFFSDSLYLSILAEADLARSYFIAQYALKEKKVNFLPSLIRCFKQMNEKSDSETMLTLLNSIEKLAKKESLLPFLNSIRDKLHQASLVKVFNRIARKNDIAELPKKTENLSYHASFKELKKENKRQIEIVLTSGRIKIELFPEKAPQNVHNILGLIRNDFYSKIPFHRVIPNFVAQAGDPRGDGWGGSENAIPCEYNDERFIYGTVGIATSGKDTGSSQFFIMQSYSPHLDGKYTVIGRVVKGFDILEKIDFNEEIFSITILD